MPEPPKPPAGPDQPAPGKPPAASDQHAPHVHVVVPAQGAAHQREETGKRPPGGKPATEIETVKVSAGEAGKVKDLTELPPIPRAGFKLAIGVGGLIALVTILIAHRVVEISPLDGRTDRFFETKR
jgi:hypothetical protein